MAGRKKRSGRVWLVMALGLVVMVIGAVAALRIHQERAVEAKLASERLAEAALGLDEIYIDAKLDPDARSMTVRQTLYLTSRAAESRDTLVLRTWPNAFQKPDTSPIAGNVDCLPNGFSAGSLVIEEVTVAQDDHVETVMHRYIDEAKTALELPLAQSWQPGENLMVTLKYTVHFPHAMYRFGWWEDTFMAGQVFATPALWQNGAYRTDAYLPVGDPLSGECANYILCLTVPQDYAVAATGSVTGELHPGEGLIQYIIEAPATREVGLVISPTLRSVSRWEGNVQLLAYAGTEAEGRRLLDTAAVALECFSQRYGSYPYPTYTVCAVPIGVSGAEYSGLSMIARELLGGSDEALEYAVVHETAHQWWYGLVGSDSVNHAWMDEALCEFSLLQYVESRYGRSAREELRQNRVETSMRVTLPGTATPGAPLSYFDSETDYTVLVYGRAASLLCAMDDMVEGQLDEALRTYAERYGFSVAGREDFTLLLLEETGMDMEPLMVDYLDTHLIN